MDTIRYYDIRLVNGETTSVQIENRSVENAGSSYYGKALIRVLGDRGWGYVCVSPFDIDNEREKRAAIERAAKIAKRAEVKADIADVPSGIPRTWSVSAKEQALRPLEEKAEELLKLEQTASLPGITSTSIRYGEHYQTVFFEDSNGYEATSEICRSLYSISTVATAGADMQMNYEQKAVVGPIQLMNQRELSEKCAKTALSLLKAKAVSGGTMPAILDPAIAGVFAHEAVGHASEGDQVRDGVSVLGPLLGKQVGSKLITIIDDPSMHGYGYEPFDAEGIASGPCELIKDGVVNKFMHSRETLAAVGLDSGEAGHARAEPGMQPLVRMSNTYIKEGDATYEEILETCKNGVLLIGSRGGQVDPGRGVFQFNAKYGYRIENGETTQMLRNVSLSGDILSVLHNIELCGKERIMSSGTCGKGQNVPVSDGAPHIYLTESTVGGTGNA